MDFNFRRLDTLSCSPLWHKSRPGTNSVALGVVVLAGTRDECWPEQAGLAHAVEHILFQGTNKFSSSEAIDAYVEEVGGSIDASTSNEMTFFKVDIPAIHARRGGEILGQLLTAATYPKRKIRREMEVIIHEMKDANDSPEEMLDKMYDELVYGNHPLGRDILGTEASVTAFQQEDFIAFKNQFYTSNNMAFLSAGGIGEEDALRIFDEFFPPLPGTRFVRQPENLPASSPKEKTIKKDVEQVYLELGASAGAGTSQAIFLLVLFEHMLSGGGSFPLFQEVRDKRGLCYNIGADLTIGTDVSDFSIHLTTSPKQYKKAMEAIFGVIQDTKTNQKILERAKTSWVGNLIMASDNLSDVIDAAASDIVYFGAPRSFNQIKSDIEIVTIDDIQNVVDRYLPRERFSTAMIVPRKNQA